MHRPSSINKGTLIRVAVRAPAPLFELLQRAHTVFKSDLSHTCSKLRRSSSSPSPSPSPSPASLPPPPKPPLPSPPLPPGGPAVSAVGAGTVLLLHLTDPAAFCPNGSWDCHLQGATQAGSVAGLNGHSVRLNFSTRADCWTPIRSSETYWHHQAYNRRCGGQTYQIHARFPYQANYKAAAPAAAGAGSS